MGTQQTPSLQKSMGHDPQTPQDWRPCSEALYSLQRTEAVNRNLVLVKFLIDEFVLSLFLEGNDNQGNKDVDEEERKNNEVDDVEYGHLHSVARLWSHVLLCGIDRMS